MKKMNEMVQFVAEPHGVFNANDAILFEDLSFKGYRTASVHRS